MLPYPVKARLWNYRMKKSLKLNFLQRNNPLRNFFLEGWLIDWWNDRLPLLVCISASIHLAEVNNNGLSRAKYNSYSAPFKIATKTLRHFLMAKQVTSQALSKYHTGIPAGFTGQPFLLWPQNCSSPGDWGKTSFNTTTASPIMKGGTKNKSLLFTWFPLLFPQLGVRVQEKINAFTDKVMWTEHPTPPTAIHLNLQGYKDNDSATCPILVLLSGGYGCPATHSDASRWVKTCSPLQNSQFWHTIDYKGKYHQLINHLL